MTVLNVVFLWPVFAILRLDLPYFFDGEALAIFIPFPYIFAGMIISLILTRPMLPGQMSAWSVS